MKNFKILKFFVKFKAKNAIKVRIQIIILIKKHKTSLKIQFYALPF